MNRPRPLPASHLPVFAAHVRAFGKLTLSEHNALEVFRGYQQYLAYRQLLQDMAKGRINADLSLQAKNALRDDKPVRVARQRLIALDTVL